VCDAIKPEYSTTPPYLDERVLMKGQKEGAEERSELEGVLLQHFEAPCIARAIWEKGPVFEKLFCKRRRLQK